MAANTFGELLKLTTFGESHGKAIGGVLDGFPSGVSIDFEQIKQDVRRRRPGQSRLVTPRNEEDEVEFLSGIYEGVTTGSPIAFVVWNKDVKSDDYEHLKKAYRPSHADFTYQAKYGHRDHRGGGRSSARETVARVVAGAISMMLLKDYKIKITGFVSQIGTVEMPSQEAVPDQASIESSLVRCPHHETSERIIELIEKTRLEGDTLGGIINCIITDVPAGLGAPVFDKLHADLAKAMLSINAVKGFEIGSGFESARMKGSQHNDPFISKEGKIHTLTNHSGGIQGGISNGENIYFRVAFKPVASLMRDQQTLDDEGNEVTISGKGRHDVCVVPRAVPIVEAMAALVITDHLLRQKIYSAY